MTDCWRQHSIIYTDYFFLYSKQRHQRLVTSGMATPPWLEVIYTRAITPFSPALSFPTGLLRCTEGKEQLPGAPPGAGGQWCLTWTSRDALTYLQGFIPQPWEQGQGGEVRLNLLLLWELNSSKALNGHSTCLQQSPLTGDWPVLDTHWPKPEQISSKKPIRGLAQCRRGREWWNYYQGTAATLLQVSKWISIKEWEALPVYPYSSLLEAASLLPNWCSQAPSRSENYWARTAEEQGRANGCAGRKGRVTFWWCLLFRLSSSEREQAT